MNKSLSLLVSLLSHLTRKHIHYRSTSSLTFQAKNVAVLGASGGIGQPLSLLLKLSPLISNLSLYDIQHTKGIGADLSHIETRVKVKAFVGPSQLADALKGMDLVLISAGVARRPGMTLDDVFITNASIIADLVKACAKNCPRAIISIITEPINSTVPVAAEVMKAYNVYDKKKVIGVTTLNVLRAATFVAEAKGLDCTRAFIPVVGGYSRETVIPLLSQISPPVSFSQQELDSLTSRIQNASAEILEARDGAGSARLSTAHAGARFSFSVLDALNGKAGTIECGFTASQDTELKYFATPLLLGRNGVEKSIGLGKLSEYETKLIEHAKPKLQADIQRGIDFAKQYLAKSK